MLLSVLLKLIETLLLDGIFLLALLLLSLLASEALIIPLKFLVSLLKLLSAVRLAHLAFELLDALALDLLFGLALDQLALEPLLLHPLDVGVFRFDELILKDLRCLVLAIDQLFFALGHTRVILLHLDLVILEPALIDGPVLGLTLLLKLDLGLALLNDFAELHARVEGLNLVERVELLAISCLQSLLALLLLESVLLGIDSAALVLLQSYNKAIPLLPQACGTCLQCVCSSGFRWCSANS